ncbi:MAG: zinc metalloprotease HtpX [candidate division NC10 bacterium]|nr:zinc metalloprotease HtpX [candidate division NC10 bacterium]
MRNTFKTVLLLGAMTGLLVVFGDFFGGRQGMVIAFLFALLMNFGSYWYSDKIVLRMYRAREVTEAEAPELVGMVRSLSQRAHLPMPRVYIVPVATPNAFATGRNPQHAAVAVTEGILRIMDYDQLEGVVAHELGHVKNRDTLVSAIAATLAGVIMMLAYMARWAAIFGGVGGRDDDEGGGILGLLVMSILAPLAAVVIQMAISRTREFLADATAGRLTKKPYALASALEQLQVAAERMPLNANPATSHLFIVNPLSGRSLLRFFSTHPPVEERVKRLRALQV